jgi:predicted pyridoxine 5'-phosphate oxidase superfamily flavin-nucleotide-binding protein
MTEVAGWHDGERALQERAGVADRMTELGGRVLRDHLIEQHRAFYPLLPMLFTGSLDAQGQPWASLLAGPPGFASAPTPHALRVAAQPLPGDVLAGHLAPGAPLALLGLQAHTRRRNRLNGRITALDDDGFELAVGQSFGNCPRYIHPREALYVPAEEERVSRELAAWDDDALAIIRAADTLFIATAHPQARTSDDPRHGLDVSHRGGPAGFVQVDAQGDLLLPDYAGNTFFNTLGNLQLEPRCGLLFVDWASGARLHVAARGELAWQGEERFVRLQLLRAVHVRGGLPLQWREAVSPS